MATLQSDFEDKLREAVLDEAERKLIGERNNAVFQAIQAAHERLRQYAVEFDYDVEPIIDSLAGPEVERSGDSLTIRWGWDHGAAVYLEFGTSEHTVEGNPLLSFVWDADDAPEWVAREFEREGDGYRVFLPQVEVAGVRETRFVRDSLNALRRNLQR